MNQPEKSGYYWFRGVRKITPSATTVDMEEPVYVTVGGPAVGNVQRTGDLNYYLLVNFIGEWVHLDPECLK